MGSENPKGAFLKSISATYNNHSLPRSLRTLGALEPEVWGLIVVDDGHVLLCLDSETNVITITPDAKGVIPANTLFCFKSADVPVRFHIEYYHEPVLREAAQFAGLLSRKEA